MISEIAPRAGLKLGQAKVQRPPVAGFLLSKAGEDIGLEAEQVLIVALSACAALQSNNYAFRPIPCESLGAARSEPVDPSQGAAKAGSTEAALLSDFAIQGAEATERVI